MYNSHHEKYTTYYCTYTALIVIVTKNESRNFLSKKQMVKIKVALSMTDVGKMFEDEKEQYGKECEAKGKEKGLALGHAKNG